jgi:hypothetical protein
MEEVEEEVLKVLLRIINMMDLMEETEEEALFVGLVVVMDITALVLNQTKLLNCLKEVTVVLAMVPTLLVVVLAVAVVEEAQTVHLLVQARSLMVVQVVQV